MKKPVFDGKREVGVLIKQMQYVLFHYEITEEELNSAIAYLKNAMQTQSNMAKDSVLGKTILLQYIKKVMEKNQFTKKDLHEAINYLETWKEEHLGNSDQEKNIKLSKIPLIIQKDGKMVIEKDFFRFF